VAVAVPSARSLILGGTFKVVVEAITLLADEVPTLFTARTSMLVTVAPGASASLAGDPPPLPMVNPELVDPVNTVECTTPSTVYRTS